MSTELFSLSGRRAVVTGGGRGLGQAVAAGLAAAGATVAVVSRTAADVEAAAAGLGHNVVPLAMDVASGDAAAMVDAMEAGLGGPFDVIVLSGSVFEVPRSLLAQLKPGGRLTAIVGQLPIMQAVLVTRSSESGTSTVELFDAVAPRLTGFGEPSRFVF